MGENTFITLRFGDMGSNVFSEPFATRQGTEDSFRQPACPVCHPAFIPGARERGAWRTIRSVLSGR